MVKWLERVYGQVVRDFGYGAESRCKVVRWRPGLAIHPMTGKFSVNPAIHGYHFQIKER